MMWRNACIIKWKAGYPVGNLELKSCGGKDWKDMHQIVSSCFRENHVSCSAVVVFPEEPCNHV